MTNKAKLYEEREDGLILEIAELKNEISKCVFANGQLNEDNQRLMEEFNNRAPSPEQGISICTQTLPIQQNEYISNAGNYAEDPSEIINRKLQQQQALFQQQQQQQQQQLQNLARTASQTINPYDYYYQQAKPPQAGGTNYQKSHLNNQSLDQKQVPSQQQHQKYDHESESNSYSSNHRYGDKNKPISNNDHHSNGGSGNGPITFARDSRRGSASYTAYPQQQANNANDTNNNSYRESTYSLNRNDDGYLMNNNFRPFTSSVASSVPYRQGTVYHQQQQQQATMSTVSAASSRGGYQTTQSSNYQNNSVGQRSSHSIHANPNGYSQSPSANTDSSAYNSASLQRQRELDTANSPFITKLKLDDRPTLSMSSNNARQHQPSSNNTSQVNLRETSGRYASNNLANNNYSRSNSIVNMNASSNYKSSNSMKFNEQNEYSNSNNINGSKSNLRHEEPSDMDRRSTRRDSSASIHSTSKLQSNPSIPPQKPS